MIGQSRMERQEIGIMPAAMDPADVRKVLNAVRSRRLTIPQAMERLSSLPVEHLGYARYDTHRALRKGFAEVVFGKGKSDEQLLGIIERIAASRHPILI